MTFSAEVRAQLKHYVYRLIDPRDGSTFYIGKGQGDRVFAHLKANLAAMIGDDEISAKISTISQINNAGLEPIHIIHRHGMTEDQAFQVEAALIDIYPGLTNEVSGHGSSIFGPAHAQQIQRTYTLETMNIDPNHKLIFINIKRSIEELSTYEAVRAAWDMNKLRAENANFVLAVAGGVCRDVFLITQPRPRSATSR